jgi:haloalkane dehalogenase
LYRKVIDSLAEKGLRGVTLDFPGLGFADRPDKFDYTWTGLSEWLVKALDAAGIENFHLCVHDIGGPIGFDLIRRIPDRILSLTVLNTLCRVNGFRKPWIMQPFEYRGLGYIWTRSIDSPLVIPMMRFQGVMSTPSNAELRAYGEMLCLQDKGAAFLKIMRSFENNKDFEDRILAALKSRKFPAQVVFGKFDTALNPEKQGKDCCEALSLDKYFLLQARHFVQEDAWDEVANHISELVKSGKDRVPQ